MSAPVPSTWFSRLLFVLTLGVSAGLILLVILAPLLDNAGVPAPGWPQVVRLFAQDRTLRRTAVASSLGLVVTACVFFRPAPGGPRRTKRDPRQPPPPDIAGA